MNNDLNMNKTDDTISRQAAIKILHEALDAADQIVDVPFGVYQNYRDKINALPPAQLSTNLAEVGTDCISRQAAIEALGEKPVAWSKGEYERGLQNQWGYDVSAIKQLPPAQPRIKGHWIEYIPEHGKCPFCGNQVDLLDGRTNNFCSECGAKMEREVTT